ncbi:MAG: penicillin-binding protein activator [Pseudomonadota bacterium]
MNFAQRLLVLSVCALAACAPPSEPEVSAPVEAQPTTPPPPVVVEPNSFNPNQPVVLGLLVPANSGNDQTDALAQSLINAADMAVDELGRGQFFVNSYATGGDAAIAADMASLAMTDGARMIIGPLFSTSVRTVVPVAGRESVPVLALSNNTAVRTEGAWLLGVTFDARAQRIVSEAVDREVTRLGVIYSADVEGRAARDAIVRAAVGSGLNVVAQASYERSQQGIQDAAELYVQTMLDAEAEMVVMTDRDSGLIFAASFLRLFGLDTGRFPVASVQPLGSEIYSVDPALQSTLYAAPATADLEAFATRYEARFGEAPHPLAPLTYEAVSVAVALVNEARRTGDITPFGPDDLTRPAGYAGPQGAFRLTREGVTDRGLSVFSVSRRGDTEVSPARLPSPRFGTGS